MAPCTSPCDAAKTHEALTAQQHVMSAWKTGCSNVNHIHWVLVVLGKGRVLSLSLHIHRRQH